MDSCDQIAILTKGIKQQFAGYTLQLNVKPEKSSIHSSDYKIDFSPITFQKLSSQATAYIIIKKDSLADRQRRLVLELAILDKDEKLIESTSNSGTFKQLEIMINGTDKRDTLNGFNYMAYIGTNFDLVDGIKAKNLFFAANVFLPPSRAKKKVGFYLSLFGNRTMTGSDSSSNVRRTYKSLGMGDSTRKYSEQTDLLTTRVSDNLGAYMSPLINLGNLSSPKNDLQLYYSPSLEFVWRRTQSTNTFSNGRNRDSVLVMESGSGRIEYSRKSTQYSNEYSFNVGALGFFLVHENKQISMRVHCSTGYSALYYPERNSNMVIDNTNRYFSKTDLFFTGRAWITEASSGLTLQAEVTNTFKDPRPYYGVTLSKALNFKSLGTFFSPITAR